MSGRPALVAWLIAAALVAGATSSGAQRGGAAAPPRTAQESAPIDLTGYWVSFITEDWRFRMITPPKGDYTRVPLTPEGRKVADGWNPAADEAAGLQCKAEWLPRVREVVNRNQEIVRDTVKKVKGCSLPVFPSKANMFVIDTALTGVDPNVIEDRLLHDHMIHVRAGGYLSRRFGSRFVRVSFSIPTEQCEKFAVAFPKVMESLAT